MNRITPAERQRHRDQILLEAQISAERLLQAANGRWCREQDHQTCDMRSCLCACHDAPSSPQYTHRCGACGADVTCITGTMMSGSIWVHVHHTDHKAIPVRKISGP